MEYPYKNREEHLAEIAQGCIRCKDATRERLVCQRVMSRTLLHLIPSDINGAKRCLIMCESCHPEYQARVYALEHSRDWNDIPPETILAAFADIIVSFAGPAGNIPKRWPDWYDQFRSVAIDNNQANRVLTEGQTSLAHFAA